MLKGELNSRILFHNLYPYSKGGLPFTSYVNQRIGRFFSVFFIKAKISPNFITFLSMLAMLLAIIDLYFLGTKIVNIILYGLLLQISYSFDCSDGQVARYTKSGTTFGAWFDVLVDRINTYFCITGTYLSLFRWQHEVITFTTILGFVFVLGVNLFFHNAINLKNAIFPPSIKTLAGNSRKKIRAKNMLMFLTDNGIFLFMNFLGVMSTHYQVVLIVYSFYVGGVFIIYTLSLYKVRREILD